MKISGNKKNLDFLKEAAEGSHLSHAYILNGPKGSGKKTFAYNAARALLCENRDKQKDLSPCGICPACKRSLSGNHPDIITLAHEKKNTVSVEDVRESLAADTGIKPFYGPYKIYIVPDASLMTVQAQNALLKTIEEPPGYVIIFLLADNADFLLDTVRSRCIRLNMECPGREFTAKELCKKGASLKEAARIAAFTDGNLGEALEIFENEDSKELLNFISKLLAEINTADAFMLSDAAKNLSSSVGFNITDAFRKWYRDILVIKAVSGTNLFFPEEAAKLEALSRALSYEKLSGIFADIDEASRRIAFNVNETAVYEALLLRIRQNG